MNPVLDVIKGILLIPFNLIIFYLFGALILHRKNKPVREGLSLIVGFFAYYILFFIVCFPFMIKYRPLSWLITAWAPICVAIAVISLIINRRGFKKSWEKLILTCKINKAATIVIFAVILVQILLVTCTYNFTLDAAYYVSNVTTSLQTNMINVYDPFTGAWQDHYEVRYLFATYSINDAVMCKLFSVPALIQTKLTMSGVVIIIVNILYVMIANVLFATKASTGAAGGDSVSEGGVEDTVEKSVSVDVDNENRAYIAKGTAIMVTMMFVVNLMFYTIFTSSLFLLTRTYEGKTIVGNLSIVAIFYIFMLMVSDEDIAYPWLSMFIISLGSMTISSSGNMLIPAQLALLFVPYMFIKKTIKPVIKLVLCMMPGIMMVLVYILYVKGFFVFFTYPT